MSEKLPVAKANASITPPADLQASFRYQLTPEYKQMLEIYIETARRLEGDEASQSQTVEVLSQGTYKGGEIGLAEGQRNIYDSVTERTWFASLIHQRPETAQLLASKEVAGFHATGSFALAGLIEDGALLSGAELNRRGKASITGAHDAKVGGQQSISFGALASTRHNIEQWGGKNRELTNEQIITELEQIIQNTTAMAHDLPLGSKEHSMVESAMANSQKALDNFRQEPGSLVATLMRYQFPVAIGISRPFVREAEAARPAGNMLRAQGYYGEFRPAAEIISIDALPVIGVPRARVEPVRQLLQKFGHSNVTVVALENLTSLQTA